VARRARAAAPQEPPPQPVPVREEAPEEEPSRHNGSHGITVPVIGARIPLPPMPPMPSPTGVPGRVLWLGGLVGAAVLGVVEWPVAAALAAGTWVVERFAKAAIRDELQHPSARRESGEGRD
jgi:hypothetical protein